MYIIGTEYIYALLIITEFYSRAGHKMTYLWNEMLVKNT